MNDTLEHDAPTRMPPQDIGAEISVLGAMLLNKDAIASVVEILRPHDYYKPAHGTIHASIVDLYSRGEPADIVTVAAALDAAGDLARVGGAPYLHTLISKVPSPGSAGYYANLVREWAEDRRLIEAGTRIVQLAEARERDPDNPKHAQATKVLYDAITQRATDTLIPVGDLVSETLAAIEAGPQHGLSTGFPDLDDITNGLLPGYLWFWGARPGMGKSNAVLAIARAVAIYQHQPVLYFSLEMSKRQLMMRILAAEARVRLKALQRGNSHITDDEWGRLARISADVAEAPLFIDETPGLSIVDIQARARRRASIGALGLIVIDHVHLMTSTGGRSSDNEQRELTRITNGLKVLAKDLQVPIIGAAQLNRGTQLRADKRPNIGDFRGSGSFEQDADVAVLLHRDDYYDKEVLNAGEADFIVAKNRDGETETVTVASQLHYATFASMAQI